MTVTALTPETAVVKTPDRAAELMAQAEADAIRVKAQAEAEKQRIANARAEMKLEAERAAHAKRLAELEAAKTKAEAETAKMLADAEAEAEAEADRAQEQQRTERTWKWGARGIYAVGLVIAAPIQFIAFWDPKRPFLLAAPALLEGLALVLAMGAAWAVAHRRDVMPYRIGIMIGAMIAAGINLWHGLSDPDIGLNAGLIGALASLGGPVVLMSYEHGIAQRRDGIPSWREKRDAKKAADAAKAETEAKEAEKKAAEVARVVEKAEAAAKAHAEQDRKDTDRKQRHPEVWEIAEALRSARGAETVTEQIWADAWYRVTGSKTVGITPDIEARSKAAQARMKAAVEGSLGDGDEDESAQVESQKHTNHDAVDKRRFNGGTPPRRTPGDTVPYADIARREMSVEQKRAAESDASA
ncbi:hypothetical protein OIC43_31045 [Streptomyces sp. NBC_00825]|uniref:hypothetical protein n=1 Tax=unclassified Streptomyces TaxID=2593676 RepID=UPI002ED20BC3|nr:hypothetical protein OG832_12640 [Streptomyces sp. NBC_00826]WTH93152.1 hypothetical protein OIC43_31045 [Streptomyces sp. NBC_00825]WTI01884.1 hypothetical protein OHA23_31025 [Streptomyces sp. NBC_00822]